eukprot:GDKJ01023725.1.p1 GENE.GDKJ01023725.1~~GDKJ01023725.1.p1  ORF type:complete len:517 (+),score=177.43 GDKJ01023725.1:22-1572(+)
MGKKQTWKKIDASDAELQISKDNRDALTKQVSVDDLFSIDTTGDLKKGASSTVRKGIKARILAPVTTGKSAQHVKCIEKAVAKLENKSKNPAPKKKEQKDVVDLWDNRIEEGSAKHKYVHVPETIPYRHVPAVPLPKSHEAFNPSPDVLIETMNATVNSMLTKEAKEKEEMLKAQRPMTYFLKNYLGEDDLKTMDDICQQRSYQAGLRGVSVELVRAAVLRHRVLKDEQPLIDLAATGVPPKSLAPFSGTLSSLKVEVKEEKNSKKKVANAAVNVDDENEAAVLNSGVLSAEQVAALVSIKEEDLSDDDEDSSADEDDKEHQMKKRQKKVEMLKDGFDGRKTQAQKNKEARHKSLLRQQAVAKLIKLGLSGDVNTILKEIKKKEQEHQQALAKKAADALAKKQIEATGVVEKPVKFGKDKFKEAPIAMPLPSEVIESGGTLRKLKLLEQLPVANVMSERFTSAQRRGAIIAAPDVLSQDYARRKRKEIVKAKNARKTLNSTRLNDGTSMNKDIANL